MLGRLIDKGVEPVRWLLIVGIAYTLAMMVLVFFETPVSVPSTDLTTKPSREQTRTPTNINQLLAKHIFGQAGAETPMARYNEKSVTTRLPLELQSVFVSDEPERSTAIVAQRGKPGQMYRVGDSLPGNAKLLEVAHDQVYLRTNGIKESLPFPTNRTAGTFNTEVFDEEVEESNGSPNVSSRDLSNSDASGVGDAPDTLEEYRQRFSEDAEGTLGSLGIETSETGGYKIGNSVPSAYLQQTGLQSGDVILSINGQAVGNLQQDQMQLDNVLAQGTARIEIQRGSRRFFVTASIPNQR